jgi:hypothetical protein
MRAQLVFFATVITACALSQAALSTEGTGAAPKVCSSTHGEAFETLREAPGLVGTSSMYETEGSVPKVLSALSCLATSTDAVADMLRLLDEGNAAGQLYALIALKVLDPSEFAERIPAYRSRSEKVWLLGGDVGRQVELSRASRDIEQGSYSVLLPRSIYTPVQPVGGFLPVEQ